MPRSCQPPAAVGLRVRSYRSLWAGVCASLLTAVCHAAPAEEAAIDRARFPGAAEPSTPAAEYGEMVRGSARRTPAEQLVGMHVPAGCEVRLFAAEPDIAKPLNLAFDARGRLWLTQTTAYPYPAAEGANPTDAIKVLEDTDGDGRADRVSTFADGLNIPIGLLPREDGCIVFSIPNLLYLRDTDGDGVCDRRDVLIGPFDTSRDTHGMVNALRDGGDGWIYACHGFNNRSVIAGKDGHPVRLESGNTFRFRPDGSRVEQYTSGQVNPFGMTRDDWGYWFTADCHSKPITQLVRGGCYPSFGRPHDGLGFLPPTIDHLHGSTAISGILYVPQDSPIEPLRGQLLSGNVMTSRINRDLLTYRGATARGIELPDFLTSDDPWFRPVDLQMDASGHIYVADFYNKIIGHYEVPLEHPDRDRTSGRIWQIRYTGASPGALPAPSPRAATPLAVAENAAALAKRIASGTDRERVAALRVAADMAANAPAAAGQSPWSRELQAAVAQALDSDNAHVARAAAEAFGSVSTSDEDTVRLATRLLSVTEDDPVLRQTIRIAIRDRLRGTEPNSPLWDRLLGEQAAAEQSAEIASILLAIPDPRVVPPLVDYLRRHPDAASRKELARHAATHAGVDSIASIVELARELTRSSQSEQSEMLASLVAAQSKLQQQPDGAPNPLRSWALDLAGQSLEDFQQRLAGGEFLLGWSTSDGQPWEMETRPLLGADKGLLRSSLTRGERYVGTLVSDPFPAPATIRFRIAGHGGHPDQVDHEQNLIRLVRASDNAVLRRELTPRNDTARLITWDTSDLAGQAVRIECQDGDAGNAFAWIAVGQFEPSWIGGPEAASELVAALRWSREFGLQELIEPLRQLVASDRCSASLRWDVAAVIANVRGERDWEALLAGARATPQFLRLADQVLPKFLAGTQAPGSAATDPTALATEPSPFAEAVRVVTSHLAAREETEFARVWVRSGGGSQRLLELCEQGSLSPSVLVDNSVAEILTSRLDESGKERLASLTASLQAVAGIDAAALQQIAEQLTAVTTDPSAGGAVFTRHCGACHQLRGTGSIIGPQLDGVVTRSDDRLLQDILKPDQNVDAAFRTTSFLLADGRAIVGMVQTEDENEIRVADALGKTISIPLAEMEMKVPSPRSLMPSNFSELLTPTDLANLLRFIRNPE